MNLMKLSEYEEIKGEISGKSEAFEMGQTVAFAYMADCMGCSLIQRDGGACQKNRERTEN